MSGSNGERILQRQFRTEQRANAFYEHQVLSALNAEMMEFIANQQMVFISTADAKGNCDTSFRAGDKGFVRVVDTSTIVYPEYRGNGVYASLGNIYENPHMGLLFIDFFDHAIGLHVNGKAAIVESVPGYDDARAERWVRIDVEEAYIHCSKHIPRLVRIDKEIHWGTDNAEFKGGDFFKAKVTKAGITK